MTDYERLCDAICQELNISVIAELMQKVKLTNELDKLDKYGKSPLYLAVEKRNPMIIKLLTDNGASLDLVQNIHEANNTPRKLINNTDQSLLFLSKIKVLSDGEVTNKQINDQVSDMKQRSVTPDTHKFRTMLKDQAELDSFNLFNIKPLINIKEDNLEVEESSIFNEAEQINTNHSSDYLYYVDEYQYKDSPTSHVLHFGINIFQQSLNERLIIHEENVKKYVEDKKTITQPEVSIKKGKKTDNLLEVDFKEDKKVVTPSEVGSTVSQNNILKANEYKKDSKNLLTDFEKDVFERAVTCLNNNLQQHTVLIDVFARHDKDGVYDEGHTNYGQEYIKGDIKITPKGIRETHTVVLYKQEDKYLVIDPSNPTFSTILIGADDQVRVCFEPKLKIYKPSGDTGYDVNKWRDCIDVAVKLAFSINKDLPKIGLQTAKNNEITIETIIYQSIKEINSVKDITNQKESYQSLPKLIETNCIRAKQSSDMKESKLVTLFLKQWNKLALDMKEKLEGTKLDPYNLGAKFNLLHESQIVNYKQSHEEYITNIKDYLSHLGSWIETMANNNYIMQLEEKAIVGELSNNIHEWEV